MKVLIFLPYYNRPQMVRNALKSLALADNYHKDWVLYFTDDGSSLPGRPIVEEVIPHLLDKVRFHRMELTPEEKIASGGLMGKFQNEVIEKSDADLGIVLCDDDALYPTYLANLDRWFAKYVGYKYCYSDLIYYNPTFQTFDEIVQPHIGAQLHPVWGGDPINVAGYDSSQVAWRLTCNKEDGVWFQWPRSKSHDYHFYQDLYNKCGPCWRTNFVSQFKGIHKGQLGKNNWERVARGQEHIDTGNP